jgi:Holliday junction resolvase RusA-like endonuclease
MPATRPAPTLTVTLPIPSGQLGPNGRAHWRKKHELFKAAKNIGMIHLRAVANSQLYFWPMDRQMNLDVLWVAKQQQHLPDVDNLMARLKPYLDGGQGVLYENDRQVQVRSIRREVGSNPRVELTFEAAVQEGGDGT